MFKNIENEPFNIIFLLITLTMGLIIGCKIGRRLKQSAASWSLENRGEALVRESLEEYCNNNDAHVLNCVTLRLEDGSTTQIDHILISTKGIFVIETKHYQGWILGHSRAKFWAQIIYKNKYFFQNPTFQNHKHTKEIQRILDFLEPQLIHNFVVFSGDSIFKRKKIERVFHKEELTREIDKYPDGKISLNRVQFCVGRLEYMRLKISRKTDVEHQAYLMQKFGR